MSMTSTDPKEDEPFDLEREPLDRPFLTARDWGGDGSDLSRPVRAHVLAALRPNSTPYPPPVDALRHLGDPHNEGLEELAVQHPELREQVVAILGDVLRDAEEYSETSCTGAMSALVELEAVEALPLIRRAFELGRIDEMVRGSWGDILDSLDVEPEE